MASRIHALCIKAQDPAALARFWAGVLRREVDPSGTALPPEDDTAQRELAARIRAGDVPAGTLARVRADVAAKLQIDSPRYLGRYNAGTPPG